MSDWEAVTASLVLTRRLDAHEAKEMLVQTLEARGGVLSRNDALVLAERTGWSQRQLYRWRSELRDGDGDPGGNFIERIEQFGAKGFVFDDLATTMVYMLGGNMSRFRAEVMGAGFDMPSLATLSRQWRATVPRHVRDGARNGQANRSRNLFYVRHEADEVDDVWQLDAFDLDIRVRIDDDSADEERDEELVVKVLRGSQLLNTRPRLLLLVDDRSRFITGWALLPRPHRGADVCALFADAFEVRPADNGTGALIGGRCERVLTDNDTAFQNDLVRGMLAGFGSVMSPTPVYSPASKGKVERAGKTVQTHIVTGIAGVVSEATTRNPNQAAMSVASENFLGFDQLLSIVEGVIHRYNYEQQHSAHTSRVPGGATPFEVYSSRLGPRSAFTDEELARHYLPVAYGGGERVLRPDGVEVFGEHWIELHLPDSLIGSTVVVKSLHHRRDRLAVFDVHDNFVSFVRPTSSFSDEDRRRLGSDRLELEKSVSRLSRQARAKLVARTAELATGADPADALMACLGDTTELEAEPAPGSPKPKKRRPSSRPIDETRDRSARATLADREAKLDEQARTKKAPARKAPAKKASSNGTRPAAKKPAAKKAAAKKPPTKRTGRSKK